MDKTQTWLSLIDNEEFTQLFIEELGWDRPISHSLKVQFGNEFFTIEPVASYKGIQVWQCACLPNARIQREIDKEVSKISAERLIIFHDESSQNWRWPMSRDSSGKGLSRLVSHEHQKGRSTQSLVQRLNLISIQIDSPAPSLVEMMLRLRKAFDADQVTKKFYKEFSTYQKELVSQINGLENVEDQEWYSSLLLNRLMFIYFMQWKGFMDRNQNYLTDRLKKIKQLQGQNKFYNFFNDFLLPLFHKGLGEGSKIEVPEEIAALVGEIPYVNGGIFSEHELEIKNQIEIPDIAFETIFDFFDRYQWHLDTRNNGNPNEINPDVLGYVFEQYVNNKETGAYYTKEDITDYMTNNTLIIKMLLEIEDKCEINMLRLLVQNPDRYIWNSLKFGEAEFAENGFEVSTSALPGESIYETRNRLKHLEKIRNTIVNGDISSITELVTLNVDLELLAIDLIDAIDTPDDIIKIWHILSNLKVIDPTCGSGAFLFAALNKLEHLYSVLLDVAEIHVKTSQNLELRNLIEVSKRHANRNYFVLKHATQKNIYGVDLMREASEIARLRLFLKLISTVDNFSDIEPLPDLEFNIKSGNLLIGITKSENIEDYLNTLDSIAFVEDIRNQVQHLEDLWVNFQSAQENGSEKAKIAKKLLFNGTQILRKTLDGLFYESVSDAKNGLDSWREISQPFHWFVEFPDVFSKGGFDVVIGNPPYIKRSEITYNTKGHYTSDCPDIYALCVERAARILKSDGTFAMIVMLNMVFGDRYQALREFASKRFPMRWISGFGNRPSMLFEGVEVRNTIFIGMQGEKQLNSAPMHRWVANYRPHLMSCIRYSKVPSSLDVAKIWPFITSLEIYNLLMSHNGALRSSSLSRGPKFELENGYPVWDSENGEMAPLFYISNARYWISAYTVVPPAEDGDGKSVVTTALNVLWFRTQELRDIAFTLLVSKWMFVWWAMFADDFNVTRETLLSFPIEIENIEKHQKKELVRLANMLQEKMISNVKWTKRTFPDKRVIKVGNWDISKCRDVLVEIDKVWSDILLANELEEELLFQYFSTVKTVSESSNDNVVEEI